MTSGLAFDEAYSNYSSDITQMLFAQGDMAGFAASKPLIHPPGTVWHYSGGTSLILSRLLRNSFQSEGDYLRFPRERLFDPLAMRSAVIEADDSGTLVAASFMYASARMGPGSDSCSCRMACGKAGACCPKVGSPTP
jgi:CubicO group peptidase (beta-lactamase class C family)